MLARCRYFGLVVAVLALSCLLGPQHVMADAGGVVMRPAAGWNLVAAPPGTNIGQLGTLYTMQPGDSGYETATAATGTVSGFGYWAYVAQAPVLVSFAGHVIQGGTLTGGANPFVLSAGSSQAYSVSATPGQPVLIGNPSGTVSASVVGVSSLYTYDPTLGYQSATVLQPGQGAWATADVGGLITVTPTAPSAPVFPAASASPAPSPQPASAPAPARTSHSGPTTCSSAGDITTCLGSNGVTTCNGAGDITTCLGPNGNTTCNGAGPITTCLPW